MKTDMKCSKCNKQFILSEENLSTIDVKSSLDNKELQLTILKCPECHLDFIVQIDDKESLLLLDNVNKYAKKIFSEIKKSGNTKKSVTNNYKKFNKKLNNYRKNLVQKYNHSLYHFMGKISKMDISLPETELEEESKDEN